MLQGGRQLWRPLLINAFQPTNQRNLVFVFQVLPLKKIFYPFLQSGYFVCAERGLASGFPNRIKTSSVYLTYAGGAPARRLCLRFKDLALPLLPP